MLQRDDGRVEWLNRSGLHRIETLDAEDFALVAHTRPPGVDERAVMYQVFPDRFARSAHADTHPSCPTWAIPAEWARPRRSRDAGRARSSSTAATSPASSSSLDHLVSARRQPPLPDAGVPRASRTTATTRDASTAVDPLLGGDEALVALVEEAHARGIRVIGDLTSNHSGDAHEWFRAAFGHPGAPESEFYYFTDEGNTEYVSWLGHAEPAEVQLDVGRAARRFIEGAGLGRRELARSRRTASTAGASTSPT